jgi:hypothetical protein
MLVGGIIMIMIIQRVVQCLEPDIQRSHFHRVVVVRLINNNNNNNTGVHTITAVRMRMLLCMQQQYSSASSKQKRSVCSFCVCYFLV